MPGSWLSSPAYKDEYDVVIYDDRKAVGRIYEVGGIGTPVDVRWFWSMYLLVNWRAGIVTNGRVATPRRPSPKVAAPRVPAPPNSTGSPAPPSGPRFFDITPRY